MRYYHFGTDGKVKGSYAVPQPGVDTQLLPEQPSKHHDEWDGEDWVLNQASLDAEVAYKQKQTNAAEQLNLNDLAGKTYAQVETWIDSNVTNLTSQIAFDKKIAKIILAMLKKMDLSD